MLLVRLPREQQWGFEGVSKRPQWLLRCLKVSSCTVNWMTVLTYSHSLLPGYRNVLAICHSITYVAILTLRILFQFTKFYSLFLTLQQTLLNRTREIWWKNLTQWSSWNHILMSLNFWDVSQNLVSFDYEGLVLLTHFAYYLLCNAFSSLMICLNVKSLLHNWAQQTIIALGNFIF